MKSETLTLETPEKIVFTYNIAQLGTRAAAYVIDCLIQAGIFIVLFFLVGLNLFAVNKDDFDDNTLYYMAVVYILMFLFQWGYFLFFEALMNGQTPGKKACHIRVIDIKGDHLDFQSLVIRNLLRAADSIPFPFFNILGGLVAILQKESRRLGDLVSGTIVVEDNGFNLKEPDFETCLSMRPNQMFARPSAKERLSEKDLYILRRFLNDKNSMTEEAYERTAAAIASKLKERYRLENVENLSDLTIIEEMYKAHTDEN
ncbi:MAG: RDD family protein [Spirochaetales bacterium]|nr:RDD family protein [Spirochaetales bacterium]